MFKKIIALILIPIILLTVYYTFTAVSDAITEKNKRNINFEEYKGRPLTIAVLGEPPVVREKQVHLISIKLEQMDNVRLRGYDAVLIMKKYFQEVSEATYVDVYKSANIPFFFIKSTKSYVPFVDKSLTYQEAREISSKTGDFATGYYYHTVTKKDMIIGYGLYDQLETKKTVQDLYSRIFMTIEKLSR